MCIHVDNDTLHTKAESYFSAVLMQHSSQDAFCCLPASCRMFIHIDVLLAAHINIDDAQEANLARVAG